MDKQFILMLLAVAFTFTVSAQVSGGLPPIKRADLPQPAPKQTEGKIATLPESINPSSLISAGWRHFIGANGIVDEKKAFDLTLGGIQLLRKETQKRAISHGKNNLSVFYLCAQNPLVRNVTMGEQFNQDLNDSNSIDNLIWAVFVQRREVKDFPLFYDLLKNEFPAHPVKKYIDSLNGRLPESTEQAYAVLEKFANSGDSSAAMRIGYRYECYYSNADILVAIGWYRRAKQLYEEANIKTPERTVMSINDRIQRLILISEGKIAK